MSESEATARPWGVTGADLTLVHARDGETLAEAAYEALRTDIISGARPATERLRIEHLKRLYNVGPTPLREALQRLCADGLVLASGNRGFAVAPLDPAEFIDLNIARIAVEMEALRLSMVKGDNEWEASVVAAGWRLGKEDQALARGDIDSLDDWEKANEAFHGAMVAACGSNWLLRVRKNLHDQCERYRRASVVLRDGGRDLNSEHNAIMDAVLARDSVMACRLTEAHFARTARVLADELSRKSPA
tara:strand:- start:3073 stop:3813 length:741 start_codon:yes stop_codon:yes gene_type:complete